MSTDQYERIMDEVIGMAEYFAYKAMQEIHNMAETHKRSVGQRGRRFLEHIEKGDNR